MERSVFGGCQITYAKNGDKITKPVYGSEVYDPQKNTWTSIKAMPDWHFRHHVFQGQADQAGPDVLVMHGGHTCRPQFKSGKSWKYVMIAAPSLQIYHPGKDIWTVVSPPAGRTTPTGTTTTLRDPRALNGWLGVNKTCSGPKPSLSV